MHSSPGIKIAAVMAHFLFFFDKTYMEEVVTNIFGLLLDCGKLGWGSTLGGCEHAQSTPQGKKGKVRDFYKQVRNNLIS